MRYREPLRCRRAWGPWRHNLRPLKRTFTILVWFAVSAGLAAFFAWLISAHLAPRPFASAFWSCLIWTVLANLLFVTFNVLEGAFICLICVVTAGFAIPLGPRLGVPALPYIALAAFIGGFASSRVLYTKFST